MRTFEEHIKENPEQKFWLEDSNDKENVRIGDHEYIIEYIKEYFQEKPLVYTTTCNKLHVHANWVLDCMEDWVLDEAPEDWELDCSDGLKHKLQSVLDEIMESNTYGNEGYHKDQQVNIDGIWDNL